MGDDFRNHQVFAADAPVARRVQVIAAVRGFLTEQGLVETDDADNANRSIAVGPAARWICVYDSVGCGDDPNLAAFRRLSAALSRIAPVVDIQVSDSVHTSFVLFRDGDLTDWMADGPNFFTRWESDEDRARHQGDPTRWEDLLVDREQSDGLLRAAWRTADGTKRLRAVAGVVGWDPVLCGAGYTIDYDGIPVYFREHFDGDPVDLSGFTEFHFRLSP